MKNCLRKGFALLLILLCLMSAASAEGAAPFEGYKGWYDETLIHVDLQQVEGVWQLSDSPLTVLDRSADSPKDDRKLKDPAAKDIAALMAVEAQNGEQKLSLAASGLSKIATWQDEAGHTFSRVSIDLAKIITAVNQEYKGSYMIRKVADIQADITPGYILLTVPVDEMNAIDEFVAEFRVNFIKSDRWKMLLNGLTNTLLMTAGALAIGIAIGIVVAVVRTVWDQNGKKMRPGPGRLVLRILDKLCLVYTTVIRGTPMVVQLLILYYIVFASSSNGIAVATFSFGLNSGAYVAEIFRSGILSIDKGQMEAGRSVGLNYVQTMCLIIMPQVLKNVLPTLANEFITLIKETSVAGYVAVQDLTFAGNRIRGVTYSAFMPLIAVALIYLTLVTILTWLVGKFERRLRQGDNR